MPATAARVGFISTQFRRAIAEDATVRVQYGATARKSEDPVESFFDEIADAEQVAIERLGLLSAARRRFSVRIADADAVADLSYVGTAPVVRYRDTEREFDRKVIVTDITIDLSKNEATLGVWG
jgi:hypothetical protein